MGKLKSATHMHLQAAVKHLGICAPLGQRRLRLAELCLAHAKCAGLCRRPRLRLATRIQRSSWLHMVLFLVVDTSLLLSGVGR